MSKVRMPNPLPCGCGAMGTQDLENAVDDGHCLHVGYKNVHVVHCPLHAAAPDWKELAVSVMRLNVCYRIGSRPSGKLLDRIRALKAKLGVDV